MATDWHQQPSVDKYIKVKKGNVLLPGLVEVSAIANQSRYD